MTTPVYQGFCEYDDVVCPMGCSKDVEHGEQWSTLIGNMGGPDQDPNHHQLSIHCTGCGGDFIKHWVVRDQEAWYTQKRYVIRGISTCCESSYKNTCVTSGCKGWLTHSTASGKGSGTISFGRSDKTGRFGPFQPMFWECSTCEKKFPDDRWGEEFMETGLER